MEVLILSLLLNLVVQWGYLLGYVIVLLKPFKQLVAILRTEF
jgi:hypothetical protein